jgi:hypothetical protein
LYEDISAFLQDEDTYALPKQQRHLTALIVRKLLASSAPAVIATLTTICQRLETVVAEHSDPADITKVISQQELINQWVQDEEIESEYLEELVDDDHQENESAVINLTQIKKRSKNYVDLFKLRLTLRPIQKRSPY